MLQIFLFFITVYTIVYAVEYGFKGSFIMRGNDLINTNEYNKFGYYSGSIHYYESDILSYREMKYIKNNITIVEKYITFNSNKINIKSVSSEDSCIYINWEYDREILSNYIFSSNSYITNLKQYSNIPILLITIDNNINLNVDINIDIPNNIFDINNCKLATTQEEINCIKSNKPCSKKHKFNPICENGDPCNILTYDYINQYCLYRNPCDSGNLCVIDNCFINDNNAICSSVPRIPDNYSGCDKYECNKQTGEFIIVGEYDCKLFWELKKKQCYKNIKCDKEIGTLFPLNPDKFCIYDNSLCNCPIFINPEQVLQPCQTLLIDESESIQTCESIKIIDIVEKIHLCVKIVCDLHVSPPTPYNYLPSSNEFYKKTINGITSVWRQTYINNICPGCLTCNMNPDDYIATNRNFNNPLCIDKNSKCYMNKIISNPNIEINGCYKLTECNLDNAICTNSENLCVSNSICKTSSCKSTIIDNKIINQCVEDSINCEQQLINNNIIKLNNCYKAHCSEINGCEYVLDTLCKLDNIDNIDISDSSQSDNSNIVNNNNKTSNINITAIIIPIIVIIVIFIITGIAIIIKIKKSEIKKSEIKNLEIKKIEIKI